MTSAMDAAGVRIPKYPVVEIRPGGALFIEPWRLYVGHRTITVPAGYRSNYASIPWIARWLISPVDEVVIMAALAHDWLVREFGGSKPEYTWWQSARIMRRIMKAYAGDSRTKRVKRYAIYWAVWVYGFFR